MATPETIATRLREQNVRIVRLRPWLDFSPIAYGHVMSREEYKAAMMEAVRKIKAVDPSMKVIASVETDWVNVVLDPLPADVPTDPKASGYLRVPPEKATAVLAAAPAWADSVLREKDGSIWLLYHGRADSGRKYTALNVYPAPGNHQSGFLLEQARFVLEEVGLDGIYIDEFTVQDSASYDKWDGHTVDIDPATGAVVRKYTNPALAGTDSRLALIDYVLSRGGVLIANMYSTSTEEANRPVTRFAETYFAFDIDALPDESSRPISPFWPGASWIPPSGWE